jgi:DNA-binding transcriptional LysR family regulator
LAANLRASGAWAGGELGLPWRFKGANRQVEVPVKGSLTVNDVEFALRAGLDGIGIVQLPEALVSSLVADGKVATVLADWRIWFPWRGVRKIRMLRFPAT